MQKRDTDTDGVGGTTTMPSVATQQSDYGILGGNGADRDALQYATIVREMVTDALGEQ